VCQLVQTKLSHTPTKHRPQKLMGVVFANNSAIFLSGDGVGSLSGNTAGGLAHAGDCGQYA
jgi:hypothetical protein